MDYKDPEFRRQIADLWAKADDAKRDLSELSKTTLVYYLKEKQHLLTLTQDTLAKLIEPVLDSNEQLMLELLADAGLTAGDIDQVLGVGGTMHVPAVRKRIEKVMGKPPVIRGNPQEAVVRGALLLAPALMEKAGGDLARRARLLPAVKVQNITTYPLSVAVIRSESDRTLVAFEMIPKGTPIPEKHEEKFSPVEEGQTGVEVQVVEVPHNQVIPVGSVPVGTIQLDIPPRYGRENEDRILLRFQIDESSMLHVYVLDEPSGENQEADIHWRGDSQ